MTAPFAAKPTSHAGHSKPTAEEKHHKALVTQTQKWVAQTFYGEILKQMHNSPFKSDMMDGGRGGQAFGSMLDQQLADRMSKSSGSKLVNAIVDKIEHAQSTGMGRSRLRLPNLNGARRAATSVGNSTSATALNVRA